MIYLSFTIKQKSLQLLILLQFLLLFRCPDSFKKYKTNMIAKKNHHIELEFDAKTRFQIKLSIF